MITKYKFFLFTPDPDTLAKFYTDDFAALHTKVKSHLQVKFLQEPIAMSKFIPGKTRQVFTFLDPEGNCLQVMSQ